MTDVDIVKGLHKRLRNKFKDGQSTEDIWKELLSDKDALRVYATSMHNLATKSWDVNSSSNRITWCIKVMQSYFEGDGMDKAVRREEKTRLFDKLRKDHGRCETESEKQTIQIEIENLQITWQPRLQKKLLLDVGSCFNGFNNMLPSFHAIGVDISPSTTDVFYLDFLNAKILECKTHTKELSLEHIYERISSGELIANTFDVVVFSLLLSYFPCPKQRLQCVQSAHRLLQMQGLLLIVTPDSSHQNRHVEMMKSWKSALERIGFTRFCYEKLQHLHCMAYRKSHSSSLSPSVTTDDLMSSFYIPQDFQESVMQQEPLNVTYDETVFGDLEL